MESSAIATFTDWSFRSWTIWSNALVLMLMLVPEGIERQRGFWLDIIMCIGWHACFDDAFKKMKIYSDPEPLRLSIERPRMKAVNDRSHLHNLMKILSFTTLWSGYHGLRPVPQRIFGTCSINGSFMFWARIHPPYPQNEHSALSWLDMQIKALVCMPWGTCVTGHFYYTCPGIQHHRSEAEANTSIFTSPLPSEKCLSLGCRACIQRRSHQRMNTWNHTGNGWCINGRSC